MLRRRLGEVSNAHYAFRVRGGMGQVGQQLMLLLCATCIARSLSRSFDLFLLCSCLLRNPDKKKVWSVVCV